MSKLIKAQKRIAILLVSVVLMFYRTVSLVRSSHGQGEGERGPGVKAGLLFRVPAHWSAPRASTRYYAAELNSLFPYVHLHQVSTDAVSVPSAYPDNVVEMSDILGVTAFSLNDPQDRNTGIWANPQQPMSVVRPELCTLIANIACDDDDDCGGCGDCSDCSDCTDCSDCSC